MYRDALTYESPPGVLWSRVNSSEAIPGVMTPMTWSYYGYTLESNLRLGMYDMGIIPAAAAPVPEDNMRWLMATFHGRLTVNVEEVRRVFGSFPGVSGDDVERDLLGSTRENTVDDPYPGRLVPVMTKTPVALALVRGRSARMCADNEAWWASAVGRDGPTGPPRALLSQGVRRFGEACRLQAVLRVLFNGVTSTLTNLAERAGMPEAASALLAAPAGTTEARVADELWDLAHGRLDLATFLAHHGFHGPNSGELSSHSWREDPAPLERILEGVRSAEPPAERRARSAEDRTRVVASVLAALPPRERGPACAILRLAPLATRSLENTKTTFLLSGDAGRAAVRALGDELGLEHRDDAFHLFADELLVAGPARARALAAERKELRARWLSEELPETWEGQAVPVAIGATDDAEQEDVTSVTGLGASPGVAEGRVRIVLDVAGEVDVEPGDILVCPTTDPSWLGLMTVAGALVIDVGAAASHGAIVARELGVPCVIGTRTGTAALRDGDLVRVDGGAGLVEVLERAVTRA